MLPLPTENITPKSLTNRTHPTRHPPINITRQRFLHRTLRHARIVQIAKTTTHARRPITSFFC